ncbi:ATP-dependent helicase HrpB [Thiomicrorhabdus aquaedulcis]|uniref:ATP-dependent helicase HrpB n=1 Tax=Thiomicrorhabdus aquaedulcis TaxID=2211106 RepID=UPI001E62B5C5|nr:ATP-dependent helicase HrpB [Thiomicrorhabdus aquaedulcis]
MPINMHSLPITPYLPDILHTMACNACGILQAEPGAGKSTQVPLAFLRASDFKDKKIILLEPRRLAVRALAEYLAKQLGEAVGQTVGYQVRNDRKTSANTRLEIMTEGLLIRRLQQDPSLADTALILFDEFHERSLDADLALAMCLDAQSGLRDDLKILVMSATLESQELSVFLHNAPIIKCPGRCFPVTITHVKMPVAPSNYPNYHSFYQHLNQTLTLALQNHTGNFLVFLPGKKEIFNAMQAAHAVINPQNVGLIALHGGLSPSAQSQALQPDAKGRRKVIFATNIAQTSLTIDGITCVIDSGLARANVYDVSSGMTRMITQPIAQASAIQRAGRAGRTTPGHAYRLWSESDHLARPAFENQAILSSDLTDLALELAIWGVSTPDALRWLTAPPPVHYQVAKDLLMQLGFLTAKATPTLLGELAITLGMSARLAKMCLAASQFGSATLEVACDLAAILSAGDLFKNNQQSIDIEVRLQALQAYRAAPSNALKRIPLMAAVVNEANTNSLKWQQRLSKLTHNNNSHNSPGLVVKDLALSTLATLSIGQLLALAYPDRIAKRRTQTLDGDGRYQLSNGKGAFLPAYDALNTQAWLVAAHLDGQRTEGKLFMAAAIRLEEITALFSEQLSTHSAVKFNPDKQRIEGTQTVRLGALVLKSQPIKNLPAVEFLRCLISTLTARNLSDLPWHQAQDWLNRVRWLGEHQPEFDCFLPEQLLAEFDDWCAPYLSHITAWAQLKQLDLLSLLKARLSYAQLQTLERNAPTHFVAPSQKRARIHYAAGQTPRVRMPLQELFGQVTTPTLANGKVAITFELLSPAQRPIQITADLGRFWLDSYHEVAKEMRGQYPKHRWPEKPLEEKAGKSLQRAFKKDSP